MGRASGEERGISIRGYSYFKDGLLPEEGGNFQESLVLHHLHEFWGMQTGRSDQVGQGCQGLGQCILPLSKEVVESVAAALKESGMKSGSQYLLELKLMHIEAGYEVEAWLKRTFDLCKKALERLRGPPPCAAEVRVGMWCHEKLEARAVGKGLAEVPNLAFAWASLWMLKEIEVRKMKIQDITFPGEEKWVTIWLPTSKCDQEGRGVRRTLRW